jgi:hypothetical protein
MPIAQADRPEATVLTQPKSSIGSFRVAVQQLSGDLRCVHANQQSGFVQRLRMLGSTADSVCPSVDRSPRGLPATTLDCLPTREFGGPLSTTIGRTAAHHPIEDPAKGFGLIETRRDDVHLKGHRTDHASTPRSSATLGRSESLSTRLRSHTAGGPCSRCNPGCLG